MTMNPVKFDHLEIQIEKLMHMVGSLQYENASLRQKMAVHIQEQTRLQHKNESAAKQVKQIIKQLKEELS
jgi:uncharacterized protein (TIGR02449 family)